MSVLRPYRLERELDSAFYHWLAWLPQWQPAPAKSRSRLCLSCPRYSEALGLEELPHSPLHGLFGAVDTLVAAQFDREVDVEFPTLRAGGGWAVHVEAGTVRLTAADGRTLDELIDDDAPTGLLEARQSLDLALAARRALQRSYWTLFEAAVARLGVQRTLALRAIDAHVEPKVRRLADDLVREICGAG